MAILLISPPAVMQTNRSASDQGISSSTALTDATGLSVNLEPNKKYRFYINASFNLAGILSGYKFQIVTPTSPTNYIANVQILNGVLGSLLNAVVHTAGSTVVSGGLATTGNHILKINGLIENGANAGSLKLQFAQNTSDSSAITLKRGSYIEVFEAS